MSALMTRGDITLYQQEWYRGKFRLLARLRDVFYWVSRVYKRKRDKR